MKGHKYADLVIKLLMDDRIFTSKYIDYIDNDGFNSEQSELLNIIKNYYNKYQDSLTENILMKEISKYDDDIKETLKNKYVSISTISPSELSWTRDNILEEVKKAKVKAAILKSPSLFKDNIDEIRGIINDAFDFTLDINNGIEYVASIEERYEEGELERENLIPLPWKWFNDITEGGIGDGELMLVAAPPGIGKTSMLMQIGKHAINNGKNIVHISLELNQKYVAKRYDTAMTGVLGRDLIINKTSVIDTIKQSAKGELFIYSFPTKSITLNTVYTIVRDKLNKGIKIDGVIIDYLDLFKVLEVQGKKDHEILGMLTLEARKLAGELGIPVYSASQINRSGDNEEDIKGSNISGSYEKLMIADVVAAIMRSDTDKNNNYARVKFIKNRFGPDGLTAPAHMNQATLVMEVLDPDLDEGKELMAKIRSKDKKEKQVKARSSLDVIKAKYST